MARRGFTLVELLIVITIIAIIAGMSMAALLSAAEEGRLARARAQVAKIDQIIGEKWNAYRFKQLPIRIPAGTAPQTAAVLRLNAMRELQRVELPDRRTDVSDNPAILSGGAAGYGSQKGYRRYLTTTGFFGNTSYESAECLYAIISQIRDGDKSALQFFANSEIGDVDGDGASELLDPWGEPIMFLRWAPGHSRATMDDPVKGTELLSAYLTSPPAPLVSISVSTFQIPAGEIQPDTFDPLKIDPRWLPSASEGFKPFQLRPLIVSAGPDHAIDLFNDFGDSSGGAGHYALTSPPNDPYVRSGTNMWVGQPFDADGDGTIENGDNITNHALELQGE